MKPRVMSMARIRVLNQMGGLSFPNDVMMMGPISLSYRPL